MKKVLIPTKLNPVAAKILEEHGGYSVVQDEETALEQLASSHGDAYALIVRSEKVTQAIIDAMPGLKVVIRAGAGYNTIDTRYARSKGIDVMNTPGANANAVAEEVVALMLADARHVIPADASTRAGLWEKKKFMGRELAGKTVGIAGLGYIGKLTARRLSGFDVELIGYDPVTSPERAAEAGVRLVSLEELFEQSDYISLHMPENDETRKLISTPLLERMKDGATLVNCARAGIIDEDALRAIRAEKGLRFLNDVYPKDEAGDKTVTDIADIMLPHLGASTKEANENAARRSAQQLIEFDDKGVTSYIVNRDIPAGLDETYAELANTLARLARGALGADAKLKGIETSFYGNLKPYADWLIVPIAVALNEDFDRSLDCQAARDYLRDRGIDYEDRETDDHKGYENSITIDMTGGPDGNHLRVASVRGTVAEGNLMIARINDFDKLYFEPQGDTVVFSYLDRPGVLGQIAAALAEEGVNIDDVRNPHNISGEKSIAIIKVNRPVSKECLGSIASSIEAELAFGVSL